MEKSNWETEFEKVVQCHQRQDSTQSQLNDLYHIANRFGLYDAADAIRSSGELVRYTTMEVNRDTRHQSVEVFLKEVDTALEEGEQIPDYFVNRVQQALMNAHLK